MEADATAPGPSPATREAVECVLDEKITHIEEGHDHDRRGPHCPKCGSRDLAHVRLLPVFWDITVELNGKATAASGFDYDDFALGRWMACVSCQMLWWPSFDNSTIRWG